MKRFATIMTAMVCGTLILQVAAASAGDARGRSGNLAPQKSHFTGMNSRMSMSIELRKARRDATSSGTGTLSITGATCQPSMRFSTANATDGPCVPVGPAGPVPIPYPLIVK